MKMVGGGVVVVGGGGWGAGGGAPSWGNRDRGGSFWGQPGTTKA